MPAPAAGRSCSLEGSRTNAHHIILPRRAWLIPYATTLSTIAIAAADSASHYRIISQLGHFVALYHGFITLLPFFCATHVT